MVRNGGQVLVDALRDAGIDTMFGLEGGHIDPILHAARDAGMTMIDTRHEVVGGYAADAHARITANPAVSIATAGPGFTNVLTAIASSQLDRIPVLYISGAVPLAEAETNSLQGGFDQVAMARPVTKWADRATSIGVIEPMVKAALAAMFEGAPGPAYLEVPIDVVFAETAEGTRLPMSGFRGARPAPSPASAQAAVELLEAAERPAIIAGSGTLLSGCAEEVRQLAEAAGAPVYANVRALGILPGSHPLACGTPATLGRTDPRPDVVLILGARNGMFMGGTSNDVLPADAKLIQVDVDAREIGRIHPVAVPIVADCREALNAFAALEPSFPDRSAWCESAAESAHWHRRHYAEVMEEDTNDGIHPYLAATMLADFVDERTVIVQDGADTGSWVEIAIGPHAAGPGKYLATGYLGNLGNHQGMGIAAQAAFPDHRVLCFTGDGSLGMQMQEFDTMVRHGLPVVTVCFNNRAWGMSLEYQRRMPDGLTWVTLGENLRYDQVCEACGGHGELVERPEELAPAMERALASGLPSCVNVLTRSAASPKSEIYLKAGGLDEVVLPYYRTQPATAAK